MNTAAADMEENHPFSEEKKVRARLVILNKLEMSFLESSSNTTKNTSSKDPSYTPSERDASTLAPPSKNKWTVDLRRKGAAATPSTKGKTNISNNTSSDNTNNRSSCTFSNDVFYSGKDELETIKDDAKPILKLWASRSKQNLANRNSDTFKSTENISTNGNKTTSFEKETTKDTSPAPKQVKARYLSTSKLELNENEINEQRHNKENEEVGVINTSHRNGNNKETYTNGNSKDVTSGRLSSQKSDIPIKRVTTKSKHINSNIVSGGIQIEKSTTDKTDLKKANNENTSSRRRLKSPEIVSELKDKNCTNNEPENAELVRGKGINKRKKNKSLLEYTHLNFLKSKKSDKSDTQIPIKKGTETSSILDRYTSGDCDKDQEVNIDKDNKYIPDLNCKNNTYRNSESNVIKKNGVNATSNGKLTETNGFDNKSNGHVHESNGFHVKGKLNGVSKFDSNKFNISANNSLIRKDNRKDSGTRPAISRNQKFFVKSCDISLDSENEEPENSENLQSATRTILNNLNWDPTELTNKQIDNSPRYSELHSETPVKTIIESKQNGENKSAHVSEEITASFDKLLNEEFDEPLNGELIDKQNNKTKMSNRTSYISRSINSTSQFDDKSDTHRRLIRTSSSQIEKPTIHSRRLSNIEGSNSIDNYIRRKVSTELDRVNRNKFNTCDNGKDITTTKRTFSRSQTIDIESRRYSFEKGISDNDKSGDEFQPKSNFLRQRLKEIDNKQAQLQSKEPRKFSLGQQQNSFDENNKVDSFGKFYNRGHWSSESSNVSYNGVSDNNKNGSEENGERVSSALSELCKNDLRRSSSSSSTSSLRSNGLSTITANGIGKVKNSQPEDLDTEMNFEFRRNFSLTRDKTTQNGKIPISKQTSDNSSISRFSFSSRSNSNRSSGRSNKSISPSSSIQSLDSNNSEITSLKNSSISIPSFGIITKVQPSKLSDAKALQSTFSFRRKEKQKQTNSGDECVPLEAPVSQDDITTLHSNDNTDDCIEIIDTQPTNGLLEDKNEIETKSPDMERRASGPKSPTSGSFSLFKGRSNSTDKSPHHSKSISSYFNFNKKDKVKKDGEQVSSPPLSPVCGESEGSMLIDVAREINDITYEPPLSPPAEGRTERRGSTLKRLFQKKSSDVVSPRQSFDADSEKKARTISENGSIEVSTEPAKIKTKAKYIDSDFKAVDSFKEEDEQPKMNIMTSTPTKEPIKNEKKTTSRVLSISTRSIKKESSIDKVDKEKPIEKTIESLVEKSLEIPDEKPCVEKHMQKQASTEIDINKLMSELDVPDQVSMTDNRSTSNELDIVPTVTKVERRSRRRDRRNQALNTNDIDSALVDQPQGEALTKTELIETVPMETNEADSLVNNDISLVEKSSTMNESDIKNISVCSSIADDSVFLSPNRDDCGSSESLYASDASTKGFSSNKERIKNRKAARLEAAERRKQLELDNIGEISMTIPDDADSMEIDVLNGKTSSDDSPKDVSGTNKPSPPEVKPKKRKKHKAQRSNTEFINLPRPESEEVQSPVKSQDDGIVMKRNNKRGNQRRDRPRTLTAGIDPDMISSARQMAADDSGAASGVVNENMSFAEIKKKLLEGTKKEEKPEKPEKANSKKREKIKRTKSTKRYKTITEGIAPRDLALAAQQAKEASQQSRNVIDKETLEQITASLSLASDKRKSFRVESRPGSRHQSTEDLRNSDGDVEMSPQPEKPTLQRTKSMTTLHMNIDLNKDKDEDDEESEIKPLSELKNRFLQAMEESNQKHKEKKIVVDIAEIKRKNQRGDRANRPYTICGLDDWSMDKLMDDIGQTPDSDLQKENKENLRRSRNESFSSNNIINGSQNQISDEKSKSNGLAQDIIDHLEDLDVSESELDDLLNDKTDKKDEEPKVIENKKPDVDLSQLDDLDFISHQSSQLSSKHISDKRNVRPQRRQRQSAANNPIKSLQKREDLIDESDLQSKDANISNQKSAHPVVDAYRGLSQTSKQNPADRFLNRRDLADEAVNALRATVDFSKTKLKKVVVATQAIGVIEESFKPTEITNVLLQIKGRRKIQTSIVKYSVDSLNSNDCYIVLTPKDLLCWYGAQSNVIEKSKAAEVASRLFQKKEMGCKAFDVLYVEQSGQVENKIIRLLGGEAGDKIDTSKSAVNDEEYEKALSSAYMTYIVCERNDPPELIPLDSQCHRMPSKEILQTDSAFVFDFLDEVYVWLGRKTNSAQRQVIQKLAAEKFDEGYHKLALHQSHQMHAKTRAINTLTNETGPHLSRRASGAARRGSAKARRGVPEQKAQKEKEPRPPHAILCQLFEGSEWVVFKEKFCDWPDESRIIRMKGGPESVGEITKEVSTEIVINPVDADEMIKPFVPPKMVLDMMDVGRGRGIPKGMDGYHVITIDVKTWHVCENKSILLSDESFGQFHSGEGYVIRWQYKIVKVRNLRNCPDISKAGGMEKCCYFFWLGNDCSINEEGATAVMTIELDQEKGPQIRVVLGKEPPALLNVFDGSMVIHAGKRPVPGIRDNYSDNSIIRLYCIRNEIASEACLLQVPPYCESLRSRSSFVLLLCQQGEVLLWHGCRSNGGTRATAEHAAKQLMANHPEEASISHMTELGFTIIEEGEEPEEFWILLGGKEDYGSMLDEASDTTDLSPRLFKLESATGSFIPTEIVSPSKTDLHNCPFPILQDDLYNVDQPAIFLLDVKTHIYLWFGWWSEDLDAEANNSRRRRWDEERKKAMESAQSYANALERPLNNMYAIYAGLEPESFIELFPYWVVQDDITDLQIDEGIEEGKLYKITEELAAFTKEFYTITELRASTTPQGVDPTKLEKYLSEEDFLFLFGFTKESFYTLPGWQQVNWKKKLGLY